MHRALSVVLACATILAGCVGRDAPSSSPSPTAPTAALDQAMVEGSVDGHDGLVEDRSAAPVMRTVPLLLDGNVGTTGTVCVFDPVGQCHALRAQEANSGLVLEDLAGRIEGGEIILTWEAASPATEELSVGFMVMDGGDGCEPLALGGAHGASPLTVAIEEASRPLCAGEVAHLWVSGATYAFQDPVYYQVDVDQAFHAEGAVILRAGSEDSAVSPTP